MSSESALLRDESRAADLEVVRSKQRGLFYHWGPQAWIDMVMSNRMIVQRAWPTVHYTYLPILRLTAEDPEQIDRDFAVIRAHREEVRFFDSPRERWRKRYGNFVRETEWCLLELRKHFSEEQYESIVIGTAVSLAHENSADFLKMMNSVGDEPVSEEKKGAGPTKPKGIQKLMFDMFNPAGFLTGPAEVTEIDAGAGTMEMYVPDCAWHICARAETLPNPDALPEQGCLMICKGAFEKLFEGDGGALSMEFEPHLPDTSCTVRMNWKPK
jgi:hypothetical protein